MNRNKNAAPNAAFSAGDAVQHEALPGLAAVVLARLDRRRLAVSCEDGTTKIWYASSLKLV